MYAEIPSATGGCNDRILWAANYMPPLIALHCRCENSCQQAITKTEICHVNPRFLITDVVWNLESLCQIPACGD